MVALSPRPQRPSRPSTRRHSSTFKPFVFSTKGEAVELRQPGVWTGAGGPDHVLGSYGAAVLELHAVVGDLLGEGVGPHLDVPGSELAPRDPSETRVELRKYIWQRVQQEDAEPVRVDVRVLGTEDLVDQDVKLRGGLDAGRSGPDHHEGELRHRHVAALHGCLLEAFYHPVADADGAGDPLHRDGVLLDARYPEESRLRAEREHDVVVGKLLAACAHDLPLEVDALDLGPPEAGAGVDQSAPERLGDVPDAHVARYDAGNHRPEGQIVVPGDHHHPDIAPAAGHVADVLGDIVPGESAAQDEDLVLEIAEASPLPGRIPRLGMQGPLDVAHCKGDAAYGKSSF
jgi:hypothetical protein